MPEPVLSEVVQQRLELLLSEVEPRHATGGPRQDPELAESEAVGRAQPRLAGRRATALVTGECGPRRLAEPPPGRRPGADLREGLAQAVAEFTKTHLVSVILLLTVAAGWTVYAVFQVRTTPVAAAAAPPSIVASPTPDQASTTPPAAILVHVIGAVSSPGVVKLPVGSRVQDAIEAAGGLRRSADPADLNLAATVSDGSQIVIGTVKKPAGELRAGAGGGGSGGTSAGTDAKVSLNSATLAELDLLPGIGPVTAQKIIDWREAHGGFATVSDLQQVDGIGPKTYADLAARVSV